MQLETTSNYVSIPNNSYVGTNNKVINNIVYDNNFLPITLSSQSEITLTDNYLKSIIETGDSNKNCITVDVTFDKAEYPSSYRAIIYGGVRINTKEQITYSHEVSIYTKYNNSVNLFILSPGKYGVIDILNSFCNFIMETYGLTNVTYSSGNYYRGWLNNIPSGFIIKDINSGFVWENANLRSIIDLRTYVHAIADPINGCKLSMSGLLSYGFYAFGTVIYGNKVNADVTITKSFI